MVGLQPAAWPSGPGVIHQRKPAVGLEPTWSALRERCPARRASPALEQPVLVSSQLDRGSEPQSPPRAWPAKKLSQNRDSSPAASSSRAAGETLEIISKKPRASGV